VFLAEEGSEDQENQPYSYYKSSAGQNLFTSTSGFSGLIKTRRKGGVEQNIDYFVKLNLGWVAAGIYMDSYDLLLYEVKKKPKNLTVRSTSTLNVTVPSVGLLSLVDKDAPFDFSSTTKALDFGELMPNESQSFDVVVKTNSQNYSVYFTSENRGRLKGQQHPSVMIPYTLKVNGRSISLRSASSRVAQGGMALFGERYTNTIVIAPNLSGKTAQTYSDTITVTLSVD
jgi:spore coat protein U-like protein